MTNYDVYLVGVGGQGVLTIGEILAETAAHTGIPTSFYPTKGMAQRGGAVKAQLRLGRAVMGPIIPERGADLVIAMELSEALKAVRFVKPEGEFLLFGHTWLPTAVMLGKAEYPTAGIVLQQVQRACKRVYYLSEERVPLQGDVPAPENVFVLGAALGCARLGLIIRHEDVAGAIEARWTRGVDNNLFALRAGMEAARKAAYPKTAEPLESQA